MKNNIAWFLLVFAHMSNGAMYSTKYLRHGSVTTAVLGYHWTNSGLSRFHPGSILEHQSNTGSPGIIPGLPFLPAPLLQSIPERQSYTGSPGIIPGQSSLPSTPVAEYPGMPELHWQSWDYPGTTFPPAPLW